MQETLLVAVSPSWYSLGMSEKHPKHGRWFQFRLRTLLIVVLVLSLPLSWFAVRLERARRQKEAVAAVRELDGEVIYEPKARAWQPLFAPLRSLLGRDFTDKVTHVLLQHTDATDDVLDHVKWLDSLFELCLFETQITDDGLGQLEGLTDLRHLDLRDTDVTAAAAKKLQEALPNCDIKYGAPRRATLPGRAPE